MGIETIKVILALGYANYFKVGYNAFAVSSTSASGKVIQKKNQSKRSFAAPVYAKKFIETIKESITIYEKEFEIIRHDNECV